VRAIGDKGGKERDVVTEDVGDSFDDSIQRLTLVQYVAQAGVDRDHVVDVPEYLLDKVRATVFQYDIRRAVRRYPNLCMPSLLCILQGESENANRYRTYRVRTMSCTV
jgi:hypothetical protein